jgi:hypothetical protein
MNQVSFRQFVVVEVLEKQSKSKCCSKGVNFGRKKPLLYLLHK